VFKYSYSFFKLANLLGKKYTMDDADVVLLRLFYKGTSSEEFDDALSAQCDGDVLQTKLRPEQCTCLKISKQSL
jgi:hypothetical protein